MYAASWCVYCPCANAHTQSRTWVCGRKNLTYLEIYSAYCTYTHFYNLSEESLSLMPRLSCIHVRDSHVTACDWPVCVLPVCKRTHAVQNLCAWAQKSDLFGNIFGLRYLHSFPQFIGRKLVSEASTVLHSCSWQPCYGM